jgi:p-aminobenzoyl-glutamate transporter AbgT
MVGSRKIDLTLSHRKDFL